MNVEMAVALLVGIGAGVLVRGWLYPKEYSSDKGGEERKKENYSSLEFETLMRQYLLESLESARVEYVDRRYCPIGWNERLKTLLSCAITVGILSEIRVREILDKKLKRSGRACFEAHLNRGTYPNHVFWSEALAYALREGEFSTEEIARIPFYHDDNAETFIKGYGEKNLLEVTLRAFLPD